MVTPNTPSVLSSSWALTSAKTLAMTEEEVRRIHVHVRFKKEKLISSQMISVGKRNSRQESACDCVCGPLDPRQRPMEMDGVKLQVI